MVNRKVTEELNRVFEKMKKEEPGTNEYKNLIQNLIDFDKVRLAEYESDCMLGIEDRRIEIQEKELELNQKEVKTSWKNKVNPNIIILVAFGIFSTLSITNRFEILSNRKRIDSK